MRRRRGLVLAGVLASLVAATRARAEARDQALRLSWVRDDAAASCPDARRVAERVRARLGRDPFSDNATASAEVFVTRADRTFVAHVRIRDEQGTVRGDRTLQSSESCETLASAVALSLALFIDPDAALGPPPHAAPVASAAVPLPAPTASAAPPPAPCPVPAPPPSSPLPSSSPPPEAPPPLPSAPVLFVAPPPGGSSAAPPGSGPSTFFRGASATAGATLSSGLLPRQGLGARIGADFLLPKRVHLLATGMFLPQESTHNGFAFGLTAMGAGACVDVVSTRRFAVAPCVEVLVGEIYAVVFSLLPLPPGGRLWGAADALARLRWQPVGPFFVELRGGVMAPFPRYSFTVTGMGPQAGRVYNEGIVAPIGDLSAGVSFP